jgi:hypothetical protein
MKNRIYGILAICLLVTVIAISARWPGSQSAPKRLLLSTIERVNSALLRSPLARAAGGVYDTTDCYLAALQIPFPSEQVLKVFSAIPTEDTMMFITPGNDAQTELVYRSISYLGWPRPIGEVRCKPDGSAESLFAPRSERPIRWLIFHDIASPADLKPRLMAIGPHLTIAPVSELKEWKSYCSQ